MLIDNIYIILRNSKLFYHYALKGHNYNTDFYESIESENNAVVIFSGKESDKENIFANFEGIIQGDNSVLIKNTNRFDYLHCKYMKNIDNLRIKLYPNFRETHSSVEIFEYKKSLPLIIQKAFDKKPIFPNGSASEIIVFPIVSPPESTIKPELQNNTYYDDTIDERLDKFLPVLGFVVAHDRNYRPLGRNWANLIQVFSQAISVGINHSDNLYTTKAEQERITRHEIKAYTTQIMRTIETTRDKASYLHNKIQKSSSKHNDDLDTISQISQNLELLYQNIIPEFNVQLESFKAMPLLYRLGIPMDIMPETIDIEKAIKNQLETFNRKKTDKGIYNSVGRLNGLSVEIHPIALRHILDNIFSNVYKYARDNRTFSIKLAEGNSKKVVFENESICDINNLLTAKQLTGAGVRGVHHGVDIDGEGIGLHIIRVLSKTFLKKEFEYEITSAMQLITSGIKTNSWVQTHRVLLDFSKISK